MDAAHRIGLAIMLDVVYNHFGPEGNYLPKFGPYFTAHHQTPWGEAVNYDSDGCEHVRRYVVENALYWIREYHLDGLRLDAVQTIKDDSPQPILAEIQERVQTLGHELNRKVCVIAETDENDSRYIKARRTVAMGWTQFGVTTSITPYTLSLLASERATTRTSAIRMTLSARSNDGYVFQGRTVQLLAWPREARARKMFHCRPM